ncbi:MAG: PqqD family protein [Planctomycetota bacterium]
MDSRTPRRTPNVLEKDVDGELIIVNANTNELVSPSESGRAIWDLIDNHRTVDQIVEQICADYELDAGDVVEQDEAPEATGDVLSSAPGTVEEQVRSFVDLLVEKGLAKYAGEEKEA